MCSYTVVTAGPMQGTCPVDAHTRSAVFLSFTVCVFKHSCKVKQTQPGLARWGQNLLLSSAITNRASQTGLVCACSRTKVHLCLFDVFKIPVIRACVFMCDRGAVIFVCSFKSFDVSKMLNSPEVINRAKIQLMSTNVNQMSAPLRFY